QTPHLTLEALPKENVYRILSLLDLPDRKRIRECCKTLRDAVQQSDLTVTQIILTFSQVDGNFVNVKNYNDFLGIMEFEGNYAESFPNWLKSEMKQGLFFRRLKCDILDIHTGGISTEVDESMLEQVTEQFHFAELAFLFFSRIQPNIINFARRSKKPIHSIITSEFSPDPIEIFGLPCSQDLSVHDMEPGFSDEQILELAKQERRMLRLPVNLSNPATLQRLIEIVHSTSLSRVYIVVAIEYYHRFLKSIALREEGNQFLDVSDPSAPVLCFEIDSNDTTYFLDTGSVFLGVRWNWNNTGRILQIVEGKGRDEYFGSRPVLISLSLSRVCPGHDRS
ncbi:hypothetical protein PFISCL1PPCAC_17963, partial [Pristionchus fissidentatus]